MSYDVDYLDDPKIKYERDLKNAFKTAYQESYELGYAEGVKEVKFEVAHNLKQAGITNEFIQQVTGLTLAEIELL